MADVASPLTESQARERLAADGPNALPARNGSRLLSSVVKTFREPMFALLLASGLVYAAVGDLGDALVLLAFASVSAIIAVLQDHRSGKVLDKLRELGSPTAWVRRATGTRRIPAAEIVRGDLVLLNAGDRAPADGRLLQAQELEIDESLLTGESLPVPKSEGAEVLSGTVIARGQGLAVVTATGARARLGELGQALKTIATPATDLVRQSRRLVRMMGLVAVLVCLTVFAALALRRGDWAEGLLASLAVGMALTPEEVPLVMTVFSVMGAWRIARAGVLARQVSAIDGLGAATVLCTDKTGTLTQNRMAVVGGWKPVTGPAHEEDVADLARIAALASPADPVDPMERAFVDRAAPLPHRSLWATFGVSEQRLAMVQVWAPSAEHPALVAAKGAPESIADLCALDQQARATWSAAAGALAATGARVLGLACGAWSGSEPPSRVEDLTLLPVGLIGLADPVRPDAREAVSACRRAGVRVIMITGDHPVTARAIACQVGIDDSSVVSGETLMSMPEGQLQETVRRSAVFARVPPMQKLRIVEALQSSGETVAMTGDGVNDAPALRAADVGIAMGARGSDVAREAAGLVLIHDGLGVIAQTIGVGRRIFANLRLALSFILAVHVPIAGLALAGPLLGGRVLLLPMHIAMLEVFIDPVCSVAFEAEPPAVDLISRGPRPRGLPLFPKADALAALAIGLAGLGSVLAVFAVGFLQEEPIDQARGGAFAALVAIDVCTVLAVRAASGGVAGLVRKNRWMAGMIGAALTGLLLALYTPQGQAAMRLRPPSVDSLACIAVLAPSLVLLGLLLHRLARKVGKPLGRTAGQQVEA